MNIEEYNKVKDYTYEEYCNYLKEKYGMTKYPYFSTNWNRNPKITRTKEGLFCHHIKEDTACNLSAPEIAKERPYEYQLPENLVYCNWLEHLFLHILISEESYARNLELEEYSVNTDRIVQNVGVGGIFNYLVPWLNDIYSGFQSESPWQQNCISKVLNNRDTYLNLIQRIAQNEYIYFPYSNRDLFESFNVRYGIWDKRYNEQNIEQSIEEVIPVPKHLEDPLNIKDIREKNEGSKFWLGYIIGIGAILLFVICFACNI